MMIRIKFLRAVAAVALMFLLTTGALMAQSSGNVDPESVAEPSSTEQDNRPLCDDLEPEVAGVSEENAQDAEPNRPESVEDCIASTPEEALGDSVDPGEMRATMRRFVPSEQISEDSSVAFPNDI